MRRINEYKINFEQKKGHFLLRLKRIRTGTSVDKLKSSYGGTKIKEEMDT